ncbi:RNA-binding S4 domain-containing protein [Xylophilus sp. GOD-11R]|uniref:RNA-binding S4 domain-containing protein n=1 Tax=Xylophilus sp. GOD-11R TaxID=3089814 RepID=UPI00298C4783|nr:RNA-binding S4 domain-containing protein [Xylophilus sp. GOD-11R]WPB58802.1 RNA-binding S4 domain-containing protein [Xylophilus sp. GOD-11R]
MTPPDTLRLDKWLWSARFFKTRSLAVEEIGKGRIQVNDAAAKPSRDIRPGDTIAIRQGALSRTVLVLGLSAQRGPAPVAQKLYEETPESLAARAAWVESQRLAPEPGAGRMQGRPTKRDRRAIDHSASGWGERWSASVD